MSQRENGSSNQYHQEIDQSNLDQENKILLYIVHMQHEGSSSNNLIRKTGAIRNTNIRTRSLDSNIRYLPFKKDMQHEGSGSKNSTQDRATQTSFEIQPKDLDLRVINPPIEDQNKEVMKNEIKESNFKKSDIKKEADLVDLSPHSYSKEELISIFKSLYGWIELLLLELEPRSIIPNFSTSIEILNKQDIEYIINQILILFKKIEDYQKSSPNSSLPKDRETIKIWQKAYFELKDQETEERNDYSLLLREIILGVTQNDFRPISKKDIK